MVASFAERAVDGAGVADVDNCPAEPIALTPLAEAALDALKKLSKAERCAVARHSTLGHDSGDSGGMNGRADPEEHSSLGKMLTNSFMLAIVLLTFLVGKMMVREQKRYQSRILAGQGRFQQYLKYRFGYWYTWTPGSSAIVLSSVSICLLIVGGVLNCLIVEHSISEGLWKAWIWIAAPDGGGSEETPMGRAIGMMVSIGGMLIFALLMSIISSKFEETLSGLRNGVGPIIEGDHVVILGYLTPELLVIVKEICIAEESRGGVFIAILTPSDKAEVEDFLKEADGDMSDWKTNSTVDVRKGFSYRVEDLTQVAVQAAKKVIIMSKPGVCREEADSLTTNVLLTLRNNNWPQSGLVTTQCELVRNQGLFKRLLSEKSRVLTTNDFVGELMVTCAKQRGLMEVITSIFSFEGDEFYIQRVKGTAGRSFMEVHLALPDVILVGLHAPGCDLELMPSMDRILKGDEELCVLAEDASTLPEEAPKFVLQDALARWGKSIKDVQRSTYRREAPPEAETVVVIGWNDSIGAILYEIEDSVGSNSEVVLHSPQSIDYRKQCLEFSQKRRKQRYEHIHIRFSEGKLGARFQLEELPLERCSMILVLADDSCDSASMADRQTMAVIVQVKDILEERWGTGIYANGQSPLRHRRASIRGPLVKPDWHREGGSRDSCVIMPQLLEIATEETIVQTGIREYCLASRLAARMMAVVSEVPFAGSIIDALADKKTCKFYITELSDYPAAEKIDLTKGLSFNEVMEVVAVANEVAVGWSEIGGAEAGPWEMNPKSRTQKREWTERSRLVVLRRGPGGSERAQSKTPP